MDDIFFMPKDSDQNDIIKKDNRMIEARYKVSIHEQRLLLAVLAQIRSDDEDFKKYTINVQDIAKAHGLTAGKDLYKQLYQAARTLRAAEVDISIGETKRFVGWLNYVEYIEGKGKLVISFNSDLKPYLLQLKSNFTQYKFTAVANFKSLYSIRFYEFLKMNQYHGGGSIFFIQYSINDLRNILHIQPDQYKKNKDFRVKVIEPALKEIQDQTDLNILNVEYLKDGKIISAVKIYAEPKKQMVMALPKQTENEENQEEKPVTKRTKKKQTEAKTQEITLDNDPIVEALVNQGFSLETAKAFKNSYSREQIERNIAYTLAKKKEKAIKDIPAYLNKAIEEDWGGAWEKESKKTEARKQESIREEEAKKADTERKKTEEKQKNDSIINDFFTLAQDERRKLIDEFLGGLILVEKKMQDNIFNEKGENAIKENRASRALFLHFLKKRKDI